MFSKLYMKIALYFSGIIATTLVAVSLLFFFTMGRPLAHDIHTMLRNHTRYVGALVKDSAGTSQDMRSVSASVNLYSANYGFDVAIINTNKHPLVLSPGLNEKNITLTPAMFQSMEKKGIFVQKSHFGRPLIYMFPQHLEDGTLVYIYISKHFRENRSFFPFLGGVALLGCFLIAAVYPLSRNITRPLSELSRSLTHISQGEFTDTPAESSRSDEIGQVLRVFRHMSQSVDHMIQSKKQLMADISHELCSPLARIRVGTELIREASSDEKTHRYLQHIENDICSMDHLIMNLSVYSRLNLPGFALSLNLFNPLDLINHIVSQYRPTAEKKGVVILNDIQNNLPSLTGDFEGLKQVFSNLMDNALRYTERDGRVVVGVVLEDESMVFFVEDSGPGVPYEFREKIFEPLFRVDMSRNQDAGCSGLGLAISKKIVELHGGLIAYSRHSDMTRFTFRLPLHQTPDSDQSNI
jgi:signal transduction histidine kinase